MSASNIMLAASSVPASGPRPTPRPLDLLIRVLDTLYDWQARHRERNALAELDPRMLKDLGLTRTDIGREIDKPFWSR